jgi:hypothetical protein
MLDAVKLDICTGIFGKKNPVTFFDLQRNAFAVFSHFTWASSNNLASLGLFFGCIGNDDSAGTF